MSGYPDADEAKAVSAAEQLMVETMARYDPSHDAYHVRRVRKTALALARAVASASDVSPDLLVVELSALLHDMLDKKYVSTEAAADPYNHFLPFFQSLPVDIVNDGRAETIAKIVENVSWTTERKLREKGQWGQWHEQCVELHCVQDADRLDAIGAFGVMRCAAFSAATNRPLYVPSGESAEQNSAIAHFHDKLLKIRGRLKTEPGREMGEKRHQLLLDFVDSVEEEFSASIN